MEVGRKLRRDARAILKAAIQAASPADAVKRELARRRDLDRYQRIFVVGAGKASGTMARSTEQFLGPRLTAGRVIVKEGDKARCRRIILHSAAHPVPNEAGQSGASQIAQLVASAGPRDLVICLISGGASALMPLPAPGISLAAKQETTSLLLACGATIHEMNAVRKHLSAIKGGRLAAMAAPAAVLSLILSDVIGDPPDVIGSGPTAPDSSTFATALAVLNRYAIRSRVAPEVLQLLERGIAETPKPADPLFARVQNVIIGSNQQSLNAAAAHAKLLGYRTLILSSTVEGETRDVAGVHAAIARQIRSTGQPVRPPACIISGGETTVTLRGSGCGGRNQEFALAAAIAVSGLPGVLILSAGTDGTDGPTTAAGAVADGHTLARSSMDAAKALANNDSHTFFAPSPDLIVTGPTGTNVMDLHLILVA